MTTVARAMSERFSIQRDSEILRKRIAPELRLRMLRRNLHILVTAIERDVRRAA
jgi:hypothetical protein